MKRNTRQRLLTRRELSVALNVHVDTLTNWQDRGLPIARRGSRGKASLYDLAAVQAWQRRREADARQRSRSIPQRSEPCVTARSAN
jgi:phage terminase Nu1 subunit (DNA packaging protein)